MSYFTFTDASKRPRRDKHGFFTNGSSIGYDKPCKVICPDNTVIEENSYDGYGCFGGHDIFLLVLEWNKEDLPAILRRKNYKINSITYILATLLKEGKSDEEIIRILSEKSSDGKVFDLREGKRWIGITISCEDEDTDQLKFPIKIVNKDCTKNYNQLGRSYHMQ